MSQSIIATKWPLWMIQLYAPGSWWQMIWSSASSASPPRHRRTPSGRKPVDEVVEVPQPGDRLGEHVVEDDLLVDRDAATLDVLQDLAAVVVETVELRNAAQSVVVQVGQQLVDGWRPRPGRAAGPCARRASHRPPLRAGAQAVCRRVALFHRGTFSLACRGRLRTSPTRPRRHPHGGRPRDRRPRHRRDGRALARTRQGAARQEPVRRPGRHARSTPRSPASTRSTATAAARDPTGCPRSRATAPTSPPRSTSGTATFDLDAARYKAGIKAGDEVKILRIAPKGQSVSYEFLDFRRGLPLTALAAIFSVLVVAGRPDGAACSRWWASR